MTTTQATNGHRHGGNGARRQRPDQEPPHSIEAEEATLGAAMLATHAAQWMLGNLRSGDFYRPAHRIVYDAMAQLARDGAPVDATSVVEALRLQGQLHDVGGAPFVHTLVAAVPTASNVGYYGRVVRQAARQRAIIDLGTRIAQLGYEVPGDPDRALAAAQLLVDELARDGTEIGLRPPDLLEAIRERQRAKAAGRHASWGIAKLDELCDGLAPGTLVLLAALTSTGKSSLAIQVAAHNADRLHVLYVTYEMTPADTGKHTFAAVSGHSLDDGATFLDSPSLEVARHQHNALDLTVYDHQPDATRLLHEVRSLHARRPLGLIVVDYVQKIPPTPGRQRTRNEEVGEVSALLKTMALRCDLPVLACAQLNRGAVGRRPGLADLRDSGQLEQDADQVVFLHRPSAEAPSREAILAKNRMGPADVTVRLAWHAKQAMFADL
jgi:replicative DNA helicase